MKTLLLIILAAGMLFAQTAPPPYLYFTAGRVLARGQNTMPDGFYGLKTYRIEEVRLEKPVEVELNGSRQVANRAFRVIIVGERFSVRALSPMVWAGDALIGQAQENADQTELTAVTFNSALIPEDATLSISYGRDGERQALVERIRYTVRP